MAGGSTAARCSRVLAASKGTLSRSHRASAAQRPAGLGGPAGLGVGQPLGPVAGGYQQCVPGNPGPCQGQEFAPIER